MEMYADEESRGGVLEPEGIVNIKYRRDKQLDTMARLDPAYGALRQSLNDKSLGAEELSSIKAQMTQREETLLPVYMQIALQFADLHDRAGRMEAKGTIRHALQWKNARRFFYWRVRRRLSEEQILKSMAAAAPSTKPSTNGPFSPTSSTIPASTPVRDAHLETLKSWTGVTDDEFEHNDSDIALWYEENKQLVTDKIEAIKSEGVAGEVAKLLLEDKKGALRGVQQALTALSASEKEAVLGYLSSN